MIKVYGSGEDIVSVKISTLLGEGLRLHQAGCLEQAEVIYQQVLQQAPRQADAFYLLGSLRAAQGRHEEAISLISRAIRINSLSPAYYFNLGNSLQALGRFRDAIKQYRAAIGIKPGYAAAWNNLGLASASLGDSEAEQCYRKAIQFDPVNANAYYNLGLELKRQNRVGDAIDAYNRAIRLRPDYVDAIFNLARIFADIKLLDEAAQCFKAILKLKPDETQAWNNLGAVCQELGDIEESVICYREALSHDPDDVHAHCNLVAVLTYCSDDPAAIFAEATDWNRKHASSLKAIHQSHDNSKGEGRRLRVGYVSPDFREHAVAYFLEPLLANHDHSAYEIYCYSDVKRQDEVTNRLRSYADNWRDCVNMSDEAMAQLIRDDRIDVLVDLAGPTKDNRLLVFARKPASVQVSWFGFPVSTGLTAMDYRFTDVNIDPDGCERYCSEQLIRLQGFYAAFRPDAPSPDVPPLPALEKGYVTFASLNNLAKVTPSMLALWARILHEVPNSRLLFKAAGLDSPAQVNKFMSIFRELGIPAERLIFQGRSKIHEFLALNREVDIALDTFPFGGGVTSFHSLWMGLPIITLTGNTSASRVGKSILTQMGLTKFVTSSHDEYADVAHKLAGDFGQLSLLRLGMRDRMHDCGLLDGETFALKVEDAYREVWRKWCHAI